MSDPIWVFGSNRQGRHGKGAALHAKLNYGAIYGQAEGRQGNSYAICTKELRQGYPPVTIWDVAKGVGTFLNYAQTHPELDFIVSPVGCGLASFKAHQIAPLFFNSPWNVKLPDEFLPYLADKLYSDGGCVGRNPSPIGGSWAWCSVAQNKIVQQGSGILEPDSIGLPVVTNNFSEAYAAYRAILAVGERWNGTLFTDSLITLRRLTDSNAFEGIPTWFSKKILEIRRNRKWKVVLVKGHPSKKDLERGKTEKGELVSEFNVFCDEECGRLAKKFMEGKSK